MPIFCDILSMVSAVSEVDVTNFVTAPTATVAAPTQALPKAAAFFAVSANVLPVFVLFHLSLI